LKKKKQKLMVGKNELYQDERQRNAKIMKASPKEKRELNVDTSRSAGKAKREKQRTGSW
jgi:hypothetical protein